MYTNVHCSFVHNNANLETIQMSSTDGWLNKLCAYMPYDAIQQQEETTDTIELVDQKGIMLSEKASPKAIRSMIPFMLHS